MAKSQIILTLSLIIFTTISLTVSIVESKTPTMAPAGAPGPVATGPDCTTLIYNMTDCLSYVTKGSNTTKPDKPCCPELAGMLDSNPICLCQMLGNNKDLPIELDFKKALNLPTVCGLQTPPLSMCAMIGIPIGAPTGSPIGSPTGGPIPSSVPSISVSPSGGLEPEASGPSPSPGKSTSAATKADIRLVYFVAALAMALTSFTF